MPEITLIRHGQAQALAKDPASYDQLSDLGHQQARWLGDHFRQSHRYDVVLSGNLKRQIQTTRSLELAEVPHEVDGRLNELDYYGLATSLHRTHGVPFPKDIRSFADHVPQILEVWRKGDHHDGLEEYGAFRARISAALGDAAGRDGRVLLVTSTGVIATLAAMALGLDTDMKSKIFLRVAHTSVHKFQLHDDELYLTQFGATPHLDHPDRSHARTYA